MIIQIFQLHFSLFVVHIEKILHIRNAVFFQPLSISSFNCIKNIW